MAQIYLKHKAYINLPMILRVVGLLLVIEAAFMVIPCLTALYVEEESVWPFLICLGITGGCGALMTLLRPKSRDMGKREAILLTGFTWVVLSLFGMLPFMFYGTISLLPMHFSRPCRVSQPPEPLFSIHLWMCLNPYCCGAVSYNG